MTYQCRDSRKGYQEHPRTPDPYDGSTSKRQFDGLIKAWRRNIHIWDTKNNGENGDDNENKDIVQNTDVEMHIVSEDSKGTDTTSTTASIGNSNSNSNDGMLVGDIHYDDIVDYDDDDDDVL